MSLQRFLVDAARIDVLFLLGFLTLAGITPGNGAAADDRPNLIFIFADDLCYDSINALGNTEVETPHLDRLAREGTSLTHAYNMGSWSGAVCVASRTMLNSGRFVWNAKAIHDSSEKERREGRWWGEMMKAAGYKTYMTGKWHCKASAEKSFDVVRDVRPGMPKDFKQGYNRPIEGQPDPWSPSDPKWGGFWEGGTHWSEVVANHAEDFFADAATQDKPAFMYLAFNATHDPRQAPKEYLDKYPASNVLIPPNFQPLHPYANEIGCGKSLRDEKLAPFPRTEYAVRVHRREYYALLTHMDTMIGRILDAVEASGKADNTWIFFTADHGLAVGQHGLLGKQNPYDHSVRVPFLVKGPGVAAGQRVDEAVYLQDVMPTTLELAQIEKPTHVEFNSVLPILQGQPSPYAAILGSYLGLQRSIRTRRHKLIVFPKAKTIELYDMQNDPHEINNLVGDPKMQPIVRDLFRRLVKMQVEQNDSLKLSPDLIESI